MSSRPGRRGQPIALALTISALVLALWLLAAPRAVALSNPCVVDSTNLITNGSMYADPPDAPLATGWHSFVLSGSPDFSHVTNEQIDPGGSQYIQSEREFDAGIYQTVSGLMPGATYRFVLGYALAAYDDGSTGNKRGNWIGRQVGIDPTGGTNPSSSAVQWGTVYWDGIAAVNIPVLSMTFTAQTNSATVYLRAINTQFEPMNKVWFDAVSMVQITPPLSLSRLSSSRTMAAGTVRMYFPFVGRSPVPPPPFCQPTYIATISVGAHPKGLAVDPATRRVFAGLYDTSSVAVVDANSNSKTATWSTGSVGHANGVGYTFDRVFVSLRDTSEVAILDSTTGNLIATKTVGTLPYGVGAADGRAWVANYGGGSASVVDAAGPSIVGSIGIGANSSLVAAAGSRAFMTYGGGVAVVNSNATIEQIFTQPGSGSFGVAFNSAANKLYVSNRNTNKILVVDGTSGAIASSITLSQTPYALAYNPVSNRIYTILADVNQVDIRDGTTLNPVALLSVGNQGNDGGDGIAIVNGRVYIANNGEGTISVIQDEWVW